MLLKGIEPSTFCLQDSCSTIKLKEHIFLSNFNFLIKDQKGTRTLTSDFADLHTTFMLFGFFFINFIRPAEESNLHPVVNSRTFYR